MSAPHSVLLVSNHGDIVGGGEISLLTLLKGLDRSRWTPVVVVPSEGNVAHRSRLLGISTHVIPLPSLRRPGLAFLRSIVALCRTVRATGATLLHANGSRAMLYAGLAGLLTGRPVIWHLRVWRSDPKLDWLLARLATRIIAISKAVRARLRPWPAAHRRCVVVPNALDLEAFVPSRDPESVRRSIGIPSSVHAVGTVGRLVPFKGHEYLLEAFAQLRYDYPAIRLLVVGDGPRRAALEQQARALAMAEVVHFTGHREDVPDILSILDVFILPSIAEDFGRVLIEAMAMERPVVATRGGGVPEIIEHGVSGLLVPPADPVGMADAVRSLLADPVQGRAMGRAGRQCVERQFNLQRHASLVEALYAEVEGSR